MAEEVVVFISHRGEDGAVAKSIANHLASKGLGVYLDVIDLALVKDGPELGDYLKARLGECSQLLAVISAATKGSWWVPWEIGVATERNYRIATFLTEGVPTPGYLQKWPYLRTRQDLDKYVVESKHAQVQVLAKSGGVITKRTRAEVARDFHRSLKRALGQ